MKNLIEALKKEQTQMDIAVVVIAVVLLVLPLVTMFYFNAVSTHLN